MTRSISFIKSSIWQLIYQFALMVLGFLVPRYIILIYGSEINGLQSTITQVLNVMTLLSAGAITASVYDLYKPLENCDYKRAAESLHRSSKYFQKIGLIFFVLMCFGSILISSTLDYSMHSYEIIAVFFLLGLRNTADIVITSKYRIILMADQKRHITSIAMLIEQLLYYGLLFWVLYFRLYFVLMYICLIFGCVVKVFYLRSVYRKLYFDILPKTYTIPSKKNRFLQNTRYAMINEMSHASITGTIVIIISYQYGLIETSIYSIYALVITAINVFSNVLLNSFAPSFGSLIASGNRPRASEVFKVFHCFFTMFNTVLYMCTIYLIIPFTRVYTYGISDVEYGNRILSIFICIYGLVFTYRIPFNILISTNGLFKETWKQPLISAIFSLLISIIAGKFSMPLILLGPISFYINNLVFQYLLTLKSGFIKSESYLKEIGISITCFFLFWGLSIIIPSNTASFSSWIFLAMKISLLSVSIVLSVYYLFDKNNFKSVMFYGKATIKKLLIRFR